MADIKANALPTATPALTDKLFGIGSSQEYQAAISDIASVILTSYTNSSLGTSSKNIVGAINELNGNINTRTTTTQVHTNITYNSSYVDVSSQTRCYQYGKIVCLDLHIKLGQDISGGLVTLASNIPTPVVTTMYFSLSDTSGRTYRFRTNGDSIESVYVSISSGTEVFGEFTYITSSY